MPHHRVVKIDELVSLFNLPEKQVARQLGVCLTSLKKICRQNGISRWPYRKLKSLDKKINKIETALSNSGEDPTAMLQKWELLKAEKKNLPFAAAGGLAMAASSSSSSSHSSTSSRPRTSRASRNSNNIHHHHHLGGAAAADHHSAAAAAAAVYGSPVANAGCSALSSPASSVCYGDNNNTGRLIIKTTPASSVHSSVRLVSSASSVASSAPTPIHGIGLPYGQDAAAAAAASGKRAYKVRSPAAESVSSAAETVQMNHHHHSHHLVAAPSHDEEEDSYLSSSCSSSEDDEDDMMLALTAPSTPNCEPPRAASRHRPAELDVDVACGLGMMTAPLITDDRAALMLRANSSGSITSVSAATAAAAAAAAAVVGGAGVAGAGSHNCEEEASLLQEYYCRPDSARFSARGILMEDCFRMPQMSPVKDHGMDDFFPMFTDPLSARMEFSSEDPDFFTLS